MSPLENTVQTLEALIAFPTVSSDSNLSMIAYLAERLETCGAQIKIMHDESGNKANLFATLGPEIDGGIILSGHCDVVPAQEEGWHSDPFQLRQHENRLYGRGSCDMKGFIAAVLAMAPVYASGRLKIPLHFAFTHDEETGCMGARSLVTELAASGLKPAAAIIGEPTQMRVIDAHKGYHEYTTRFRGLEGHGSDPDAGVSAIEYATRYAARLLDLREELKAQAPPDSRFSPPWTTLQIGEIHGGVAHNVIAPFCDLSWELRPVQDSDAQSVNGAIEAYCAETLLPEMQAVYPEAAIDRLSVSEVVGLKPRKDNRARDIAQALTGANSVGSVAFGTEAGLFQGIGIPSVLCGPGAIAQAHKANEFVTLSQLELCLKMLRNLEQIVRP